MDFNGLLALLALMSGGQQPPAEEEAVPEEVVVPFDWTKPLQTDPFAPNTAGPKMAVGGSIDELLEMLQQRG
jgi:hypothetical protein